MEKPKDGWVLKRDSASKLTVWFEDGNKRTFYSMDWRNKHARDYDKQLGIERLKALATKFGKQVKTAIIYNIATKKACYKWCNGQPVVLEENTEN